MKSDYAVYGILGLVIIIFAYTMIGFINQNKQEMITPVKNPVSNFKTITSGSTEPGSAQIDLTPLGFENGQLKVDFAVNTHSVDLSQYDLAKITTLEINGNKINPVSAPSLQGHHNSGTLMFNAGKDIKSFKIVIAGIPGIQERVFEWK